MSKIIEYVGWVSILKDQLKESWTQFWHSNTEEKETNIRTQVKDKLENLAQRPITRIIPTANGEEGEFSHLTTPKTRMELVKISAAVMGIEFSYAAETAFVSPLLLNIGLRHRHMTLMWCLSPLLGFFITPLLGSLSDGCRSRLGRRRPFIILLSIGIILGLVLVPNGKSIGLLLGDKYFHDEHMASQSKLPQAPTNTTMRNLGSEGNFTRALLSLENRSTYSSTRSEAEMKDSLNFNPLDISPSASTSSLLLTNDFPPSYKRSPHESVMDETGKAGNFMERGLDVREEQDTFKKLKLTRLTKDNEDALERIFKDTLSQMEANKRENKDRDEGQAPGQSTPVQGLMNASPNSITEENLPETRESEDSIVNHPWGLIFTVLGTVLLDFDADACQSPSRAYMLDITIPEDHARGLSTFTIMAGLGGSMGYCLGALNWEDTFIGSMFGSQIRAVFTLVLFIFIGCVITTIRSFREIPVDLLYTQSQQQPDKVERGAYSRFQEDAQSVEKSYGATAVVQETSFTRNAEVPFGGSDGSGTATESENAPTFREYVKTIVQMPRSLQWLCVTNFFCWMSLVCYSLYFTDFVGEAVYGGDPTAPLGTEDRIKYENGVRFGCWGMSLYSLSCSIYSLAIDGLIHRFGAKRVYIYGQLVYSVGMIFMGALRHRAAVIFFSWTAGIMYATLFTMPYLLVARYHAAETFDIEVDDLVRKPPQRRGLGTDVAVVSSMVFLAQMTQAVTLGSVVTMVGTPTAIVYAAAVFAFCGSIAATRVLYLDL